MNDEKQFAAISGFEAILADATRISKNAKSLLDVAKRLSRADGFGDLKRVAKDLDHVTLSTLDVGDLHERAVAAAEPVREWLNEEWQRRAAEFSGELVAHLKDRFGTDFPATVVGKNVEAFPFVFELDAEHDRAQVTYAGEPLGKTLPLDAPALSRAYLEAKSQLERNQFDRSPDDPDKFARSLGKACQDVCNLDEIRAGGRVRLSALHFQVFANRQSAQFKTDPRRGRVLEYPRYQFAWDLQVLLGDGREVSTEAGRLVFSSVTDAVAREAVQGRSRADALRLAQPQADGSPTFLGHVRLVTP